MKHDADRANDLSEQLALELADVAQDWLRCFGEEYPAEAHAAVALAFARATAVAAERARIPLPTIYALMVQMSAPGEAC